MSTDSQLTCPSCLLRRALPGAAESGAPSFEGAVKATLEQPVQRFDHYELVMGEDGKPVELGRGAMGVTFKPFDINLRCPVTLKESGANRRKCLIPSELQSEGKRC